MPEPTTTDACERYDMVVVGGGVNGAGIARDAAGRGLSVLLCERNDLAAHTSGASSKLIHGGLRYLEHFEFSLVAKALAEREVLLRSAPHIIWPMRFVMPHVASLRPAWMIRLGLLLYDHLDLGKRKLLAGSRGLKLREHVAGVALKPEFERGFEYSDGWVEDSRLVVLNAMDAREHGARILTRTPCSSASRGADGWTLTLASAGGDELQVRARALVNATGPWVSEFLLRSVGHSRARRIRQVKGSHIVVKRLCDHRYGYILQNEDRRVVFALPYEHLYTLIGTTDVEYEGEPADAHISNEEMDYLCAAVNRYFVKQTGPQDVVYRYSGVRPLLDDEDRDAATVTRDYLLELDTEGAPLLSVFGGKITTFRRLAEEAVDRLGPLIGNHAGAWTAGPPLPGGDIAGAQFDDFLARLKKSRPWLPDALATRLARGYGTRVDRLLGDAGALAELGEPFGDDLYEAEVRYLVEHEWARTAEDVLWRRSKLGLHVAPATVAALERWMAANGAEPTLAATMSRTN
ncbi:MAG: glycerol-3-phosphate dehydrogenase [Gammaproteobacteria bacterium]